MTYLLEMEKTMKNKKERRREIDDLIGTK